MTAGAFHLRGGFYFKRLDDETVELIHAGGTQHRIVVPVNEWASAVAATSKRGDVQPAWSEALDFLNREEPPVSYLEAPGSEDLVMQPETRSFLVRYGFWELLNRTATGLAAFAPPSQPWWKRIWARWRWRKNWPA